MAGKNPRKKGVVIPRLMLGIASVALAAMMLIIVADVVLRFAFGTPVKGAYDVVTIGLLVMVFFGIASVIERSSEILIDLIDIVVPAGAIRVLRLVSAVATVVIFLFLGWSMISPAHDAWQWGGYSLELGFPVWTQWVLAFLGLAGIVWAAVVRVVQMVLGRDLAAPEPAENEEYGL